MRESKHFLVTDTAIVGVEIISIKPFTDRRGDFSRLFCVKEFSELGLFSECAQSNLSTTFQKGTIRGMHVQHAPSFENKAIFCVSGKIFDVVVDLRCGSPTFLRWIGVELSEDDRKAIIVPPGCAHGFQTLTDGVKLIYIHHDFYAPKFEKGIRFDDPLIAICWPETVSLVSDRDKSHPLLEPSFQGFS